MAPRSRAGGASGRPMTTNSAVRLTQAERDQSFPNLRPKDAATIILIDRSGVTPKVLMGRRHHGHKFMPSKFVFPDRKSTRLNSSHVRISYAVFCLKKKK